jgi:radical SAM protein with 4Fe4S-binding SPASM domain
MRITNGAYRPATNAKDCVIREIPRFRRCAELLNFVIVPGGEVYACLRGINIPELRIGNLRVQTVETIVRSAETSGRLKRLREEGPHYIYDACQASGERDLLYPSYVSPCHFHHHALTTPALSVIVSNVEKMVEACDDKTGTPDHFE